MAAGDGWESQLIVGLAEHLAAATIGTWRPTGTYTADEVAIVYRAVPQAPDQIITLAAYPVASDPSRLADITVGVQIRVRGTDDPRVADDLGSALFDLLHSSGRQTWGTEPREVSIVDVYRQSYTSLGVDDAGRWECSHNYYVEAMRPTSNRPD